MQLKYTLKSETTLVPSILSLPPSPYHSCLSSIALNHELRDGLNLKGNGNKEASGR